MFILLSIFHSSWQISIPANGNCSILMEDDNSTSCKIGDRKNRGKLADSVFLLQYNNSRPYLFYLRHFINMLPALDSWI